jgi:hypothetical protein
MTGANSQAGPGAGGSPSAIPLGSTARIPLWRRITAFFTLSFMTVVAGVFLAGIIGVTALMILFVLERAIAT